MIRVPSLARRWNVAQSTVYRWVADGEVPAVRVGSSVMVPVAFVEQREALACSGNASRAKLAIAVVQHGA